MTADAHRLCEGKTAKGRACRAQALPGSHFCLYHDPDISPEERRARLSPRWAEVARLERTAARLRRRRELEDQ